MRNVALDPSPASEPAGPGPTGARAPINAGFDALPPPEIAARAEDVGVKKAGLDAVSTALLAVLAGAFIGLGAMLSTTAAAGGAALPYGLGRLITGFAFSLGLLLVVGAGAELFTGNNLIVMAWASGKVSTARVLRNWAIVYVGNFAGAIATAVLVFVSGQWRGGGGVVAATAVSIAEKKLGYSFLEAFTLGVLCNALVCLAVWLSFSARSLTDKAIAVVPPIAAFVAAGFEHSIANMYFVPLAMLIQELGGVAGGASGGITWSAFLIDNLIPVTAGNLVGGAGLVGAVYWTIYRRGARG